MVKKRQYDVRALVVKPPTETNPNVGVQLEIVGPERTGADDPTPVGTQSWYNGSLDERFIEKTFKALFLLGWDGEDDGQYNGVGSKVAIGVEEEFEYPVGSGNIRRKFRWMNEPLANPTGPKLGPKYKALLRKLKDEFGAASGEDETADSPF